MSFFQTFLSHRSLQLATFALLGWSTLCSAELMTVKHLKDFIAQGPSGELAATAYVQGVMEGMLGMDSLYQKEKKLKPEFCKFYEAQAQGRPERHPAYHTKQIVAAWEKQGLPMTTLAVDMVLAFMTAQYGCRR